MNRSSTEILRRSVAHLCRKAASVIAQGDLSGSRAHQMARIAGELNRELQRPEPRPGRLRLFQSSLREAIKGIRREAREAR